MQINRFGEDTVHAYFRGEFREGHRSVGYGVAVHHRGNVGVGIFANELELGTGGENHIVVVVGFGCNDGVGEYVFSIGVFAVGVHNTGVVG